MSCQSTQEPLSGHVTHTLIVRSVSLLLILTVGLGGFLGSISRYLVGRLIQGVLPGHLFPFPTLAVNVTGCLLIGAVIGITESRSILNTEIRAFLLVGILGGFTTFSAFGYESVSLIRDGHVFTAAMNVALQLVLGFVAVWIGYSLSQIA